MSISTATFSQWYQALELVFAHNELTMDGLDKDILREKYYNHNATPHDTMNAIMDARKVIPLEVVMISEQDLKDNEVTSVIVNNMLDRYLEDLTEYSHVKQDEVNKEILHEANDRGITG